MKRDVVPVQIRGLLPANSGVALFLGNDEKVFVIQVEQSMGSVIHMAMRGAAKDRPLTHDMIGHVFQGFGITIERVVITELRNATYYARLILKQENELGSKIVELDARPSDCLALAAAAKRPVYGLLAQLALHTQERILILLQLSRRKFDQHTVKGVAKLPLQHHTQATRGVVHKRNHHHGAGMDDVFACGRAAVGQGDLIAADMQEVTVVDRL